MPPLALPLPLLFLVLCALGAVSAPTPLVAFPSPAPPSATAPSQLLLDLALAPALGVEAPAPVFSWAAPPSVALQAAARVIVLQLPGAGRAALWDSGFVAVGTSPRLAYAGPPLAAATRFAWTVQLRAVDGTQSDVSAPAVFVTSLRGNVSATPIWAPGGNNASFVFLRAEVALAGGAAAGDPVDSAVAFVTAYAQVQNAGAEDENAKLLAAYKLHVNGAVVGAGPGHPSRCGPLCPVQRAAGTCTCAPEQLYDTHDVTALVAAREDAPGATVTIALAAFSTYNYPSDARAPPQDSRVLLQLHVTYASGRVQIVSTEAATGAWKAFDATAYMGSDGYFSDPTWYLSPRENFDARLEPAGWREPGYAAPPSWLAAAAVAPFSVPLVARPTRTLAVIDDPVLVAPPATVLYYGKRVFADFGVLFSGGVCIDVEAGVDGLVLFMRLAEEVDYVGEGANLTLFAAPMRTSNNYTQLWTLRAGAQTTCMHEWAQFRYVDFTALDGSAVAPLALSIRAFVVVYPAPYVPVDALQLVPSGGAGAAPGGADDVASLLSVFALSHYTRTVQTFDMYFDHVRQRDVYCVEELTIDLLQQYALSQEWTMPIFALAYVLNNRPEGFGWAEWPALVLFSVHEIFMHSGDLSLFVANYASLRRFTLVSLVDASGSGLWTCAPPSKELDCNNPEVDWPPSSRDGFVFTPTNTVVNAIAYRAMLMFSELAAAAGGHDDDAAAFAASAAALRAAINAQLFDAASGGYRDGLNTTHRAWHSTAFALGMGVPTPDMARRVAAAAVARLPAGNASVQECFPSNVWPTQWVLEGLYSTAADDHGALGAALMLCNRTSGWLAMLRANSTQTPEAWSDALKGNQEQGMTWGAAPGDVIPRFVLGVRPLSPGFASAIVQPQVGPFKGVSGTVPTVRGSITARYSQTVAADGSVATAQLELELPGNLPTLACLPLSACGAGLSVLVDGEVVAGAARGDYACVDQLTARGAGAPRRLQCPAAARSAIASA